MWEIHTCVGDLKHVLKDTPQGKRERKRGESYEYDDEQLARMMESMRMSKTQRISYVSYIGQRGSP